MGSWVAPASAIGMATLVTASALLGTAWLVVVLLVVVAVLAAGWPTLLSLPTQRGSTTVLALCGTAGVMVVALTGGLGSEIGVPVGTDSEPMQELRWLAPVLALSVVVAFTHQLLRRDFRPRLVESVTGVVSGVVVVALASGWLACALVPNGIGLIQTSTLAIAFAAATMFLPLPSRIAGPLAAVAAAGVASLVVTILQGLPIWPGVATGILIGVMVACFDRLFATLPTAGSRAAALAHGATMVCTAGGVTFLTAGLFA